jgi:undecaprenyl diphosphate synthase
MGLFKNFLVNEIDKIIEKKVRVRFIGKKEMFSEKLQELMETAEVKSAKYKTTLFLAMSYGGRLEIVEAVKKLISEKKGVGDELTEDEFEKYL